MNRFPGFDLRSGYGTPLERAEQRIAELEARLESYDRAPKTVVTILSVNEKTRTLRVCVNQHLVEVAYSPEAPYADKIKRGAQARVVAGSSGTVLHDVTEPFNAGSMSTCLQLHDGGDLAEVQVGPDARVCYVGVEPAPKPGDRVLLDPSSSVIVKSFGTKDDSRVLGKEMVVTFDDVGGQREAKRVLKEALVDPHEKKEIYTRFGMRAPKGVLLWGPPGTGKTMLAKAAANAVARLHGKAAVTSGFIYVKGPELYNKFLGETEANVRKLFAQSREHESKHGYPAVIFLDEADALLGRRGGAPGWEGVDRTVVPSFLAEMDGLHERTAFVLLATNRPDMLDPAVVRDGRIDRKVHVARPDLDDAREIFARCFRGRPAVSSAVTEAADSLWSEKRKLFEATLESKKKVPVFLRTLASGAMIASIVERAAQWAIRDEARKIDEAHVGKAIDEVEAEQRRLDHDLGDFFDDASEKVVSIARVRK